MGSSFHRNGVRRVDVGFRQEDIGIIREELKEFIEEDLSSYPGGYEGRGIVICAGGSTYFTCCWVLVNRLRKELHCSLPIEVWYVGNELTAPMIELLTHLDVTCCNFLDYEKDLELEGWPLKPLAVLWSRFKEVLFLDADNLPVLNPEFLFENEDYKKSGTIFWPDFWYTDLRNQIWEVLELPPVIMPEQESGQLLINKEMCWKELNLAVYFNRTHFIYYNLFHGDKDSFRFAWMTLRTSFYFIPYGPACCGYEANGKFLGHTMMQHAPDGTPCFLHRNLLKWNCTNPDELSWRRVKQFKKDAVNKRYFLFFSSKKHMAMNLEGDVEGYEFEPCFGDIEYRCLQSLKELNQLQIYHDFIKANPVK